MIDGPSTCPRTNSILLRSCSRKYKKRRRRKEKRGHKLDGGEGGAICRRKYVCRQPAATHTHTHARVPLRELDDFTVARHVVVSSSPSNPGFSAFPHPSLVIFLSLHPPPTPPPVTARHCLQAPVCTYVYNNVTHTPRPRLFLLFRVAARGSKAGTARGPAWFRQSGGRARSGR